MGLVVGEEDVDDVAFSVLFSANPRSMPIGEPDKNDVISLDCCVGYWNKDCNESSKLGLTFLN